MHVDIVLYACCFWALVWDFAKDGVEHWVGRLLVRQLVEVR